MEVNDLVGLGKLSESTINALAKSFGPLLKPMLTEVGGAISDPFRRIRQEREIQWYQRLEQAGYYIEAAGKPIHPVNPKILIPIAESATLETDEYLQDMWSKLIASALTADEEIHPSFIEVLKQLISLEAKVFSLVGQMASRPAKQQVKTEHTEYSIFLTLSDELGIPEIANKIEAVKIELSESDEAILRKKFLLLATAWKTYKELD